MKQRLWSLYIADCPHHAIRAFATVAWEAYGDDGIGDKPADGHERLTASLPSIRI